MVGDPLVGNVVGDHDDGAVEGVAAVPPVGDVEEMAADGEGAGPVRVAAHMGGVGFGEGKRYVRVGAGVLYRAGVVSGEQSV